MNEQIEEILRGAYDLHVHAAPDGKQQRRMDALEVARCAYEAEMGGFVLKSHDYNTAPLTYALNQMYPGLSVFGAIALNRSVGGINPDAVQVAVDLGAQVVWMPTFTADFRQRGRDSEGIRVADDDGNLCDGVHEVLEIIAAADMTLASGHISPAEAIALFKAARAQGVQRMIATHPDGVATLEEQQKMIALRRVRGVHIPSLHAVARAPNAAAVRRDDTQPRRVVNCIVTTDFGQWQNPPPAEGMRMAIAALLDAGMTSDEVTTLVKGNTAQLVGAG